jgi:hypothetical protein
VLTITVKFMTGLSKVFKNVSLSDANIHNGILTVSTHQENDEKGRFVSGTVVRMPLQNIMYVISEEEADKGTVEGSVS